MTTTTTMAIILTSVCVCICEYSKHGMIAIARYLAIIIHCSYWRNESRSRECVEMRWLKFVNKTQWLAMYASLMLVLSGLNALCHSWFRCFLCLIVLERLFLNISREYVEMTSHREQTVLKQRQLNCYWIPICDDRKFRFLLNEKPKVTHR